MAGDALGVTQMIALSHEFLANAGYEQATTAEFGSGNGRIYEDRYGLVCVAVFGSWAELAATWPDLFGDLVELVSESIPSSDAKVWETYLVMLTPDRLSAKERPVASAIRYDMRRVRKIVATGDEIQQVSDIERVLRPLLPLQPLAADSTTSESALDLLPGLLGSDKLPTIAVNAAVYAFKDGAAIVTALDQWVGQR